ncbi:mannitol 1-phosphate dehydrogenase [Colletotrichum melonis]|uniref:Mannitol 1-phosphate dehydrogenase n=1 Tax=Colletotrichum melonis TaxID=1209925 RepID=A0AAI9TXX1_9PEZI|nr:mannitol 1-phosphate dehydrogenase [Colletotrichum melonis]
MIGDAAHGTLSHSGNGAAQAIKDRSVLTGIFLRLTSLDEVEAAFKTYGLVRIPRSQKIVEITRSFGRLYSRDPHEIVLDKMKAGMREGGIYTAEWTWRLKSRAPLMPLRDSKGFNLMFEEGALISEV